MISKRYNITILLMLLINIVAFAQSTDEGLKVDPNSFVNISKATITDDTVDKINMIARSIEWGIGDYKDEDGNSEVAVLYVTFDNMSPTEIKKVRVQIPYTNSRTLEPRTYSDGITTVLPVIVPIGKDSDPQKDVTFSHPIYGSTRLVGKSFEVQNVYKVKVINAKRVNVTVESTPSGALVYFDGKQAGYTPCKIPDVSMNKHELKLVAKDYSYNSRDAHLIDVSESNDRFFYDLRKKASVKFVADDKNVYLRLLDPADGNKEIATGYNEILANEIPYGGYVIVPQINGRWIAPISVTINASTPSTYPIKAQETKAITFIAFQNNSEVKGAQVNLDGKQIGQTPLTYNVPLGIHHVNMSYYGQSKSGKLKVSPNSSNEYQLGLPNPYMYRSHWNPFDIDYDEKEWAIDFSYINKQYVYHESAGTYSSNIKVNNWGQENRMMHGMQFGFTYQPYFGYGQGLSTGLYYQLFIGTADLFEDDPTDYEHDFYIPLLYQFRLPLAENFSLFVNAGIGMQIGLGHTLKFAGDYDQNSFDVGFGYNDEYELYMPNAFQFYIPFGGGLQWGLAQLTFNYAWGLNNNPHVYIKYDDVKQKCTARMMQATFSFVF